MLQSERLLRIRALLQHFQNVSTERIMTELNISRETARRDIIELDALGEAKRVHGGLIAIENTTTEAPLSQRYQRMTKEKRAIVRKAIEYVHVGQSIFIDAGSTTSMFAEELRSMSGLTIITNSLQAILNLTALDESVQNHHEIILLGGRIQHRAQTQGDYLIHEIQKFRVDVAFLSPVGIDAKFGASSFYYEEAMIAESMRKQAQKCIILADESKFGVQSRQSYAQCADIHCIITNQNAQNSTAYDALKQQNIDMVLSEFG